MKTIFLLIFILTLGAGCTSYTGIGSQKWYDQRMQEIETAYQNKEISTSEYIALKNETESIRYTHTHRDYPIHTGISFGHYW